jgi:hypothetical protein
MRVEVAEKDWGTENGKFRSRRKEEEKGDDEP